MKGLSIDKGVTKVVRVPNWLLGMPEEWWESYFDYSEFCVISPVWGNA